MPEQINSITNLKEEEEVETYNRYLDLCSLGDLPQVQEIIATISGSLALPLSLQDTLGWSALHHAASSGSFSVVEFLLKEGVLWSLVDSLGYNAGDVAFSMNHIEIYKFIANEGFRAEVLRMTIEQSGAYPHEPNPAEEEDEGERSTATSNAKFLGSKLVYKTSKTGQSLCVDEEGNGVMQGWERRIMKATARALCRSADDDNPTKRPEGEGLSVLNVGFGLGIIDTYFQEHRPTRHVIVEPHPDVLAHMRQQGWDRKPGVQIYPGRWQDFVVDVHAGALPASFDAVYWDTFSEDYRALKGFFEHLFDLLSGPHARFSWFHGLGATSRTLHDIYTEIAEMDIRDAGLKVCWSEVPVEGGEAVWEGIKRRYWDIPSPYRLPICSYDI